ncbi:hypothetical protein ES703_104084 [subsurface metagenome]
MGASRVVGIDRQQLLDGGQGRFGVTHLPVAAGHVFLQHQTPGIKGQGGDIALESPAVVPVVLMNTGHDKVMGDIHQELVFLIEGLHPGYFLG